MTNKIHPEIKKYFSLDIHKILKDKNPLLAKFIPGFIVNWIKKIVHQDEINGALAKGADLNDSQFAALSIAMVGATFESIGKENIPLSGGAIVASNHPLGAIDGMALLVEATKIRPDSKFIVNDILMNLPNFQSQFIPVNKLGSSPRESLKRVDDTYASGDLVLIFPAGICSRKQKGIIHDLDWNKGFISRAIKYNLPIIPTFIEGKNSNRFYNIARIRRFLGIKANIEMFFLSDEMFQQKGKHLHIYFGKPIPASTFDKQYSQPEWAYHIREYVYAMVKNKNLTFLEYMNR